MSQEASTSPNHLNHMRDCAFLEENAPPFSGELSDTSDRRLEMLSRLINAPDKTLDQLSTSETSPRQAAFDLGLGFSPIFPFI